ncbi:uncharacterized protein EAE97_001981 [Botrytis byssoidea]|uniref:Uncharacterized protein n=1 Tax=Botrytis byssoidea TaxID=139641 RepID=A0A9P5IVB1_9HELO|nr:uncharacterized protein EAE97_001981 [Botrytis byssoidea]KAF7952484.1 hypothetical protein EAE97_001981 [Botrytis byssoidea]
MQRQWTNVLFGETVFSFYNSPSSVLEYESMGFMENLEGEFPSAEELAKSGLGAKKGKHLQAFWKAQCAFRGLDVNGSVDELVDRLRTNEHKPVFPELVKMQKDLRQKAADELEGAWRNRLTDSEKSEEDVKRFLRETFPINSNEDKAVLLKLRLRRDRRGPRKGPRKQWFKQLLRQWRKEPTFDNYILPHVSESGLDYEYVPGSRFEDPPNKWQDIMLMVVGRSRSTISEK